MRPTSMAAAVAAQQLQRKQLADRMAEAAMNERPDAVVPCGTCTLCCYDDAIVILPHEDASQYETVPHPQHDQVRMLKHKANGACWYLGDAGCTIYDKRPRLCREFDCRRLALGQTYTEARKRDRQGIAPIRVWRRGRELVNQGRAPATTER